MEDEMNEEVQLFVDAVPGDRRPLFDRLHAIIMSLYPEASPVMWYRVPTYRTKTGWLALGYWKNGVSLYTNGRHNIAEFKAKHPRIRTGTGSINFGVTDPLPVVSVERVVKHAMEGLR
jgi:uncharacterized protein YdhG (YjbR/CyaY superfamily)